MEAPDVASTARVLAVHRPDLAAGFAAAVPPARAAVLARLWGGLWREGIVAPSRLSGAAPPLFAAALPAATVDGVSYDDPGTLAAALGLPGGFRTELDNSVANLALAMAARPGPAGPANVAAEQSIVDGHPLHPCCRTRLGLSTLDVLGYAPEHRPVVALRLVEADPGRWRTAGVPRPPVFPVHPWQLPRALASGLVRDTGVDVPAWPLMSLRTVQPVTAWPGMHVKTAVEVQMTSAVRTLSAPAIHNGPLASALVAGLARRTPGVNVLRELSAGTVLDDRGEPQRTLGAVWRQAPPAGATVLPLALLPHRPGLLAAPGFFTALVELMVPPLLGLLTLGVALEAHGQNLLVEVDGGRPVRLHYRDLGGIHVHPGRLARAGVEMPPLIGALPTHDEDALRTKLLAAAFTTVLGSLVAALGDESRWDVVAAVAARSVGAADKSAVLGDDWPVKATTAMRVAPDPLTDRWCAVPNPLR